MANTFSFYYRQLLLVAGLMVIFLVAAPLQAATPMPQFNLSAVNGDGNVASSEYRGQVLLVNFFATWCPPCRHEIPMLVEMQKEFGPKGFTVIGISVDQGSSRVVEKFVQKLEINYPVGMGSDQVVDDFGGVIGIPVTFLIDRKGNMVKTYQGYVDDAVLRRDVERLL